MNQYNIYIPLLKKYCKSNLDNVLNSGYPYIPFLPVAFPNYENNNPKIFYVGLEPYYWNRSTQLLIKSYRENKLEEIIEMNNKEVTPERILIEWRENKGRFLEFVCKLHLYIRTKNIYSTSDLKHLSRDEEELIKEIGWGNMNSIEFRHTLQKEGNWNRVLPKQYYALKHTSEEILDPIINIIKAYNPDYIVLMGWGEREDHVFKGLQVDAHDEYLEKNYRAIYTTPEYGTKIIWTSHPYRFSFLGITQNEMLQFIGNCFRLFS